MEGTVTVHMHTTRTHTHTHRVFTISDSCNCWNNLAKHLYSVFIYVWTILDSCPQCTTSPLMWLSEVMEPHGLGCRSDMDVTLDASITSTPSHFSCFFENIFCRVARLILPMLLGHNKTSIFLVSEEHSKV